MLLLVFGVDSWLGSQRHLRDTRAGLAAMARRLEAKPAARVLTLGSSTAGRWLKPAYLSGALGLPVSAVADGHVASCLHDCTYAQVRQLLRQDRHYELVFFGVNLYGMCEFPALVRTIQQESLTPWEDLPDLLGLYMESQTPLRSVGRFVATKVSGVYESPRYVRSRLRRLLGIRRESGSAHLWYRVRADKQEKWLPLCDYAEESIHYKTAISEKLFDALSDLADRVVLVFLPDASLASKDAHQAEAWQRHRAIQEHFAAKHRAVEFMDLVEGGARNARLYRDHVHLNGQGITVQRALFERRLDELGLR
jgi:hypothetical protein